MSGSVPDLGVAREIAVRRLRPLGTDGFGAGSIGREQRVRRIVAPIVYQREEGSEPLRVAERQEDPAAFLAPFEHAGVRQDLQVAGHARLALAEDLCELADRQLHEPQKREDAQPRGVGKRLETVGKRQNCGHGDKDIKISLYGQFNAFEIIPCDAVGIAAIAAVLADSQQSVGAGVPQGAFEGVERS